MAVIGIDDTDSRERGMCTTYLAARLAARLREAGDRARLDASGTPGTPVFRPVLVRLDPAVPHKTRGNAALAVHADLPVERAFEVARDEVEAAAETDDPHTHPGLVVAPGDPHEVSDDVADFSRRAMADRCSLDDALALIEASGYRAAGWKTGRGRIGALAAVGAWRALSASAGDGSVGSTDRTDGPARTDRSYELIAYREPERWGTPRDVDLDSVFEAAEAAYPVAWDTVDRVEGEPVCVPHTPGPVLYGVRGDDPGVVRAVASRIDSEPVHAAALFLTNQGTDAHLRDGAVGSLADGSAYRVDGVVSSEPETRRGGHVFVELGATADGRAEAAECGEDGAAPTVECAAFEPTKRFRDRVRALRPGDTVTACGEVAHGTLKLEKFAVRDLATTERVTPTCSDCGRRMESAGAGQGYRCRDCGTTAEGKVVRELERELDVGWYEVPPVARRHIAKPLVRGGFDAPVHPER